MVTEPFSQAVIDDLARSGLTPTDIKAKPLGPAEKQMTNSPQGADGYVLPYFTLYGEMLKYYRVRLFNNEPKYKQTVNSSNHVYFPPQLAAMLGDAKFLLLTEGEKKAVAACRAGFPCVALSGTDSWKSRTVVLPKDAKLVQGKDGSVIARLDGNQKALEGMSDGYAVGFQDVIDFITKRRIPLIIAYDSDSVLGTKPDVQRAAAVLGYELRFRGIPLANIRQLILSGEQSGLRKIGLDDLLTHPNLGPGSLQGQINKCLAAKSAFPIHPNPKEYVNKRLQRNNLSRQDCQALSTAMLSDLDARGTRLYSPNSDALYYFDREAKHLMKVGFKFTDPEYSKSDFGRKMYRDYNVAGHEERVMNWVKTQFSGEMPIEDVYPERVVSIRGDTMYYQINDGQMVKVNADQISVIDNGEDNLLFESGHVAPITEKEITEAITKVRAQTWQSWWLQVLQEARIKNSEADHQRKLLALLYNISPWMYRWRSTQLPVEMTCGEAGSGKSTLYLLRLGILNGKPVLRNAPNDLRDWGASVASTGGLHVTDNVHMSNTSLRQELSDELCRLVTEPDPHIEKRKLYTDDTLIRTPVKAVFAITAIKQPFTNVDIIQRSIITELDKGTDEELTYDGDWEKLQMEKYGGRAMWLAHQFVFQQKLFQKIRENWRTNYKAKYRLINVEQLLQMSAEVYGWNGSWIPGYIEQARDERSSDTDWALSGIKEYVSIMQNAMKPAQLAQWTFTAASLSEWATASEEYGECAILINSRQLGKYMSANKHTISMVTGVVPGAVVGNRQSYKIRPMKH